MAHLLTFTNHIHIFFLSATIDGKVPIRVYVIDAGTGKAAHGQPDHRLSHSVSLLVTCLSHIQAQSRFFCSNNCNAGPWRHFLTFKCTLHIEKTFDDSAQLFAQMRSASPAQLAHQYNTTSTLCCYSTIFAADPLNRGWHDMRASDLVALQGIAGLVSVILKRARA